MGLEGLMLIIDRREGMVRGHGVCRPGSFLVLLRRWDLWSQSGRTGLVAIAKACQRGEGPKWGRGRGGQRGSGEG